MAGNTSEVKGTRGEPNEREARTVRCRADITGSPTVAWRVGACGGRRWRAHFMFTRMNTGRIILRNQIEDVLEIL
jgi:hypothetical protein